MCQLILTISPFIEEKTFSKGKLTDKNKGISNEVREKKYQEYVRGWVEYFRLADMKGLLKTTDEWYTEPYVRRTVVW